MQHALAVHDLAVLLERLAPHAVHPLVGALVEVVGVPREDALDQLLHDEAAKVGITVSGSVFSDDYAVIHSYVAAALGLALVPESLVPVHRGDLASAELASEGFVREIGLAVGPHAPRQLVEPFIERLLHFQKDAPL
jgi:DNA-binding transcriptional LysR family regulator